MNNTSKTWLHGLLGGAIGGAATAGSAFLGMAGAHAAGVSDISIPNAKTLGVILLSGALTSAFAYLKQSPLPPENGASGGNAK